MKERIEEVNVSDYSELAYLEYAMSVIKGRAIPSVEDGLKPVHRRILYAMHTAGMNHTSVHKKSARVVGNVLGLYHPHGDQPVYEAMVRQAQDFSVRYRLIDGQGNFGSRDGDSAAHMRYTEAKLTPITQLYLDEVKDNCVDFVDNYDGTEKEPVFLPARVPFILLNGNPGIAVGMATKFLPHNLTEVSQAVIALLESDEILTTKEIMQYIKGPDFPTKAQIISSPEEMEKVYSEGKGSVRLRAKYKIERNGKNWKLVFYEIPYEISAKNIMEEVDALFNPEDKQRKDSRGRTQKISAEQARLKNLFNSVISKYTDASDKDHPIRIVFEPKSNKQDPEELVNILLASTRLESNVWLNMTCIGRDGRPALKALDEILYEWIDFRIETVQRRTNEHIRKINQRLHILSGRELILNHIEQVVEIIRNSEKPKEELMKKYNLSVIQADDILELRLRQIGRLEVESIYKEINDLKSKLESLEKIISSEKNIKKQIIKEIKEDCKKYGDQRMTEINPDQRVDESTTQKISDKVNQEDITIAISNKEWIKSLKGQKEKNDFSFKDADETKFILHCKNTDNIGVIDENGRVYNIQAIDITRDGQPINAIITLSARIVDAFIVDQAYNYLIMQDMAYGFWVKGENLMTKVKAGKEMVTVHDNAKIIKIEKMKQNQIDDNHIAVITTDNRLVIYPANTLSTIGKGKGVISCGLNKDQKIKDFTLFNDEINIVNENNKVILNINNSNINEWKKSRTAKGNTVNQEKIMFQKNKD